MPNDNDKIIVRLTPSQIELADGVAGRRQAAAIKHGRKPQGGAPEEDNEEALERNKWGCRGELAGHEFFLRYGLELEWHALADELDASLADLGDFIDVKCRHERRHKLIVKRGDNERFAYLLVCGTDHPFYEIVAWCWGHEAKAGQYLWDEKSYFVPQDAPFMKDPRELVTEARRRC